MYDVAIVGAGPAGAVCAWKLAEKTDLKILLIDGQTENKPKMCGGLLAPDAQKVLSEMGLTLPKSVLSDPQIFSVETADISTGEVRHYQRHYLNMNRYAFDRWLLSFVPRNVDVVCGRCIDVVEDSGFVLKLTCGEFRARRIVGADGGGSLIRRKFFKPLYQYVSIQQTFEPLDVMPYSCIFDAKTSDSCSWTIRKEGCFVFGGAFVKKDCRDAFEKQKSRLESFVGRNFGAPIKTDACLLSSPRRFKDFVTGRGNVFLVGEAAGFISASSFEGISSAMISGKLLAEAFCQENVQRTYRKKTLKLRLKLYTKIWKRRILCSPILRFLIMKSGIQSLKLSVITAKIRQGE